MREKVSLRDVSPTRIPNRQIQKIWRRGAGQVAGVKAEAGYRDDPSYNYMHGNLVLLQVRTAV